ncbi:MAG TPA: hypothetical protein VLK84_00370 [Longimicrobium sp.]|nr:hypothetical protein [Longimicrobium sp.]
MIDPEKARAVLRDYHATATGRQIVEALWRHSPELARRLGVAPQVPLAEPVRSRPRGFFASFGRSVLKRFS